MKIAIIDFKSLFSEDVYNAVRNTGVDYSIFDCNVTVEDLKDYDGMVFTGSPKAVYEDGDHISMDVLNMGLPILGICYGHQLVHYMFGGEVRKADKSEHGKIMLRQTRESELFYNMPETHGVRMSHNDEVVRLASGFEKICETDDCVYAGSQNTEKHIYTLQYHPEAKENDYGQEIYDNFIRIARNLKDEKNN